MRDSLLPPNATAFEKALEVAFFPEEADSFFGLDVSSVFDPDRSPEEFLPYLAYLLKVDIWDSDNPSFQKRDSIKKWYEIRRLRGTSYALLEALKLSGLKATITEWYERDRDPYTFSVNIDYPEDGVVSQKTIDIVRRVTKALKPLRSREDISFRISFRVNLTLGIKNNSTYYHRREAQVSNA